jgi:DNA-binding LacI/PurR family transcriptional regulator
VEKVRQAATSLGYRANLLAISLRSPRPTFFALIIRGPAKYDADSISWHHQAFEGMFLAGALEASRALKLYPVVATQDTRNPDDSLQATSEVLDGGVFGAVVRSPVAALGEPLHRHIEQGTPVVVVFPYAATRFTTNTVDLDNVAAGQCAGRLLHAAGRRRWLAVMEAEHWQAVCDRRNGLEEHARGVGASLESFTVPEDVGEDQVPSWLAAKFREIRPDGIYAPSALSAVRAVYACTAAGLKIPDDVCIVGSDAALWRSRGFPSITSIDVSWYHMGEAAVRKLAELRDSGESVFENLRVPPLVHPGGSCPTAGALPEAMLAKAPALREET